MGNTAEKGVIVTKRSRTLAVFTLTDGIEAVGKGDEGN